MGERGEQMRQTFAMVLAALFVIVIAGCGGDTYNINPEAPALPDPMDPGSDPTPTTSLVLTRVSASRIKTNERLRLEATGFEENNLELCYRFELFYSPFGEEESCNIGGGTYSDNKWSVNRPLQREEAGKWEMWVHSGNIESNSVFFEVDPAKKRMRVDHPNSGSHWIAGRTYPIIWVSEGYGRVDINVHCEWSVEGQTFDQTIRNVPSRSTGGEYRFAVPRNWIGDPCRVSIEGSVGRPFHISPH